MIRQKITAQQAKIYSFVIFIQFVVSKSLNIRNKQEKTENESNISYRVINNKLKQSGDEYYLIIDYAWHTPQFHSSPTSPLIKISSFPVFSSFIWLPLQLLITSTFNVLSHSTTSTDCINAIFLVSPSSMTKVKKLLSMADICRIKPMKTFVLFYCEAQTFLSSYRKFSLLFQTFKMRLFTILD